MVLTVSGLDGLTKHWLPNYPDYPELRDQGYQGLSRLWSRLTQQALPGLVKVDGVAPTELQELGSGSQSHQSPNLHRARLVVQTAPVSFRRCLLLLLYMLLSYLSIFYQYNLFFNLRYLSCGSEISSGPDIIEERNF